MPLGSSFQKWTLINFQLLKPFELSVSWYLPVNTVLCVPKMKSLKFGIGYQLISKIYLLHLILNCEIYFQSKLPEGDSKSISRQPLLWKCMLLRTSTCSKKLTFLSSPLTSNFRVTGFSSTNGMFWFLLHVQEYHTHVHEFLFIINISFLPSAIYQFDTQTVTVGLY